MIKKRRLSVIRPTLLLQLLLMASPTTKTLGCPLTSLMKKCLSIVRLTFLKSHFSLALVGMKTQQQSANIIDASMPDLLKIRRIFFPFPHHLTNMISSVVKPVALRRVSGPRLLATLRPMLAVKLTLLRNVAVLRLLSSVKSLLKRQNIVKRSLPLSHR